MPSSIDRLTERFFGIALKATLASTPLLMFACRQENPGVTLAFGGDVNLGGPTATYVANSGGDFAYGFEPVIAHLRAADVAFVNMECCISDRGEDLEKLHSFRAPPRAAEGVAVAGIDIVSVSNNHALDFGPDAYEDTVALLADKGVKSVGIAYGVENRQEPVILEVKGQRFGFLAYAGIYPGKFLKFDPRPAKSDGARIDQDIQDLSDKVDFMVVSMHWGQAKSKVNQHQRMLARHMIDLGVDIVVGHGPHILQPHEFYGEGIIFYSLGNFVFKPDYDDRTGVSTLVRVTLGKGRKLEAEALPCQIEGVQPFPTAEQFVPLERVSPAPDEENQLPKKRK